MLGFNDQTIDIRPRCYRLVGAVAQSQTADSAWFRKRREPAKT